MKHHTYIFVGIGIALLAGGFLFMREKPAPTGQAFPQEGLSTSTVSNSEGDVPFVAASAPSLDHKIEPKLALHAYVASSSIAGAMDVTKKLRENPNDRDLWLQLAVYFKSLGDYRHSEDILQYIVSRWRSDYVAYNNLGDLYQNYLKDYPKAELAHLKAVESNPRFIQGYSNLYDLYRYLLKAKSGEAPNILQKGLLANPDSLDLMMRLGRHYVEAKDVRAASTYYQQAYEASLKVSPAKVSEAIKSEALEAGVTF